MKINRNMKINIIKILITSFILFLLSPLSVLAEEEIIVETSLEITEEEITDETSIEIFEEETTNESIIEITEETTIESDVEITEEELIIETTIDICETESSEETIEPEALEELESAKEIMYSDEPEFDEETIEDITEEVTEETIEESTPSDIYDVVEEVATISNTDENAEYLPFIIDNLIGTWTIDGVTSYRFDIDNQGAMILPTLTFSFKYTLDQDKINIIFDNDKISDVTFTFSISDDTLILERNEELGTSVFTLFHTEF